MINDPELKKKMNSRENSRKISSENASVEFLPGGKELVYQFKLRDFSVNGFGIIVRKDSRVLRFIKEGDILDMCYHPDNGKSHPEYHRTQIKHISEPDPGKHHNHLLIGLLILE